MEKNNHSGLGRPSILIIDDSNPTLELYAGALHQEYQVFTSSTSQDAAIILASQPLQLVILEPNIAGLQAWEFVEEINRTYGLPVIVCSSLEDRRSGLAAGAVTYLVKPVLPATLLGALKSILS